MYWKLLKWTLGVKPTFKNGKENGEYGEWLGRKYLKKKGFVVLYSNWRSLRDRRNEIDLICMDQEMLVFVEVRARSENSFTTGFESLNNSPLLRVQVAPSPASIKELSFFNLKR